MRRFKGLATGVVTLLCLGALPAASAPLKVATWNIQNLTVGSRSSAFLTLLKRYAGDLDADIIALQEVDGEAAARQVFDDTVYTFFFSRRSAEMRTGFAVRKSLTVSQNPDYEALNVTGGLRFGTDITVTVAGKPIRLLSVHLKSGCFQRALPEVEGALQGSCEKLAAQVQPLEAWMDARATVETPFIVLGDFNRRFGHEQGVEAKKMLTELDDAAPPNADLERPTAGLASDCWTFTRFIDHLLLDKQTGSWAVAGSFAQIRYTEADTSANRKGISDHCPLHVTLEVPDGGGSPTDPDAELKRRIFQRLDAIEEEVDALRRLLE